MDSYQQSEPGQFPLKDGDINGSGGNHPLSCTTPLKDEPKSPSKNYPGLRYEDFTPPVVTDGREVRLEVCRSPLAVLYKPAIVTLLMMSDTGVLQNLKS